MSSILARYTAELEAPLFGDVPLEEIIDAAPSGHTVKGMFFTRYVKDIGDAWPEVAKTLREAPNGGRYRSFAAYPLGDYLRIVGRAAEARFPGATREAFRLLARGEVEVFAESTLGKVTLSLLESPASALTQFPRTLGLLSHGFVCSVEPSNDCAIVIRFPRYVGVIELTLGLLEGIVIAFDKRTSIAVERDTAGTVFYTVTWSGT